MFIGGDLRYAGGSQDQAGESMISTPDNGPQLAWPHLLPVYSEALGWHSTKPLCNVSDVGNGGRHSDEAHRSDGMLQGGV
jgi:hypothetical protein